jgi:ankyrin repeat protein
VRRSIVDKVSVSLDHSGVRTGVLFKQIYNLYEMWSAAQNGDHNHLLVLISLGADIEKRGGTPQSTPLQIAAHLGHMSVLETLLEHGANTEAVDNLGRTVLHINVFDGHIRIVKLLLKYNANVSARTTDGKTAIHFAVLLGRIDIINVLIHAGSNISVTDNRGWTPLHYASEYDTPDIVYLLLRHNARILSKTNCEETPADIARSIGKNAASERSHRIE